MPIIVASPVSYITSFNSHNSPVCYMLLGCFQILATLWMSDACCPLSSAAPLSFCQLPAMASLMGSVQLMFGPAAFWFSQHLPAFPQEPCLFTMCLEQSSFSSVIFANIGGLICSRTHLFTCLVVQGVSRAHFQNDISNESTFSISLLHYPTFTSICSPDITL